MFLTEMFSTDVCIKFRLREILKQNDRKEPLSHNTSNSSIVLVVNIWLTTLMQKIVEEIVKVHLTAFSK